MMKQTALTLRRPEGRTALILTALALLFVLSQPGAVRAQQWTTSTTDSSKIGTAASVGSVGVGTMSPISPLHVEGQSTTANNYVQGYFKNTSSALPYGGVGVDGQSQSHVRFFLGGSPKWQWRAGGGTGIDDLRAYSWTLGRDVMTMTYSGNVGVGTNSPANALHVNNDFGAGIMRVSGVGVGLINLADNGAAADRKLYQLRSEGGLFRLALVNDGATAFVQRDVLVANSSGSVGMGTMSPASPLGFARVVHLRDQSSASFVVDAGGTYRSEFSVSASGGWAGTADAIPLRLVTGGAERARIDAAGNVGVGTQSPLARLDVRGGADTALLIGDRGVSGKVGLQFLGSGSSHAGLTFDGNSLTVENASNTHTPSTWYPQNTSMNFVVRKGSVGINTGDTLPAHTLEVAGTINASGGITGASINATYQDVAEWVPTAQKLSTGTVVVLDPERTNHVLASTTSYDTKVAGVVSERPGISLGEGGEGKALVATTGRVKVKVDATRAPIHVGDLLVTSDVEGFAMKSVPVDVGGRKMHAPGTIIGKALEPLESGTGEILLLLSLQ
jgi:hypothetical protein